MPKITSWSFSRFTTYRGCPFKAKLMYIDKMKDGPPGPALVRGSQLHEYCEAYLKGWREDIHEDVAKITAHLEELKAHGAEAELEFAFTREWEPCDWFAKDAWCRVKADALSMNMDNVLQVIDFKTGSTPDKIKEGNPDYELQLELYALAGMLKYPTAEKVKTSLIFTDHGMVVESSRTYTRDDLPELKTKWEARTNKMLNDEVYAPTPGNACRFCSFSKKKSGPCKF
jgi:hypothetical protein